MLTVVLGVRSLAVIGCNPKGCNCDEGANDAQDDDALHITLLFQLVHLGKIVPPKNGVVCKDQLG